MSDNIKPKSDALQLNICLISQTTEIINIKNIFESYFSYIKPTTSHVSENAFEYTPSQQYKKKVKVLIQHILNLETLYEIYSNFDTIILMVDIQRASTKKELSQTIDFLLDLSDYDSEKIYIFGFYKGTISDEEKQEISEIAESKGIDYEYIDLDIEDVEGFSKIFEVIINDLIDAYREINRNKKKRANDNIIDDNSKSKCIII